MFWKAYFRIRWWTLGKNHTRNGSLGIRGMISQSGNLRGLSCMISQMNGQKTTNKTGGCQMRPRTRTPLLIYLLTHFDMQWSWLGMRGT